MGGLKRSLVTAGLLASSFETTPAYFFPLPTRDSALSTTVTGQAIAARQARQSRQVSAPAPRTASTGVTPLAEPVLRSNEGEDVVTNFLWPSVTRSPRPAGLIEQDGSGMLRSGGGGQGEREDGKSPDFEVNLGRVISTLREDYPKIFLEPPSFDIFTNEVELRDPTGVAFRGISNYRRVFATLRFFRQTFMNDASTTFRLTYDWSKQQVRVTWNVVLHLKARQRPFHVDAISAYHINNDGIAYRHDLETVVVNGTPVEPPFAYAWINLPAWVSRGSTAKKPVAMPAPHGALAPSRFDLDASAGALLRAAQNDPALRDDFVTALSVLMAADAGAETMTSGGAEVAGDGSAQVNGGASAAAASGEEDQAAEKKARANKNTKKDKWFGLPGNLECDTSFDCTGGMVCCDFALIKVCCSNGIRQPKFGDLVPSLIPIPGRGRNENDPPSRSSQPPRRRSSGGW